MGIAVRITTSAVIAGVFAVAGTGCTIFDPNGQRLSRALTIHRHHFDPPEMTVPPNTPFDLVVSALDGKTLTISSPSLGFDTVTVPTAGRAENSLRPITLADLRTVAIPIAPKPMGVYEISCDCHGRQTTGRLMVR